MKKRPEEGDIYRENNFDTYGSKKLNCEINFHTLAGGSVIFDKCYKVWRTVAIKFWHLWTCKLVWGNIWRNDITQFMSGVKELALILWMLWRLQLMNQLNRFLALQALVECLGIWIATLSVAPPPVEEVAPLSQIPGLNLTQFNNIGNFGPNVAIHIPRHSTRACRAKNLFNWFINWRCHNIHKIKASSLTPDMNWVMSFLQIFPQTNLHVHRCQNLIATVLHTL